MSGARLENSFDQRLFCSPRRNNVITSVAILGYYKGWYGYIEGRWSSSTNHKLEIASAIGEHCPAAGCVSHTRHARYECSASIFDVIHHRYITKSQRIPIHSLIWGVVTSTSAKFNPLTLLLLSPSSTRKAYFYENAAFQNKNNTANQCHVGSCLHFWDGNATLMACLECLVCCYFPMINDIGGDVAVRVVC